MRLALWTGMFSLHCSEPEMAIQELKNCGFDVAELSEVELGKLLSSKNPEKRAMKLHCFCIECDMKLSQAHLPKILTPETVKTPEILLKKIEKHLSS